MARQILFLFLPVLVLAGCAPSTFSDRPATLLYKGDTTSAADFERKAIANYHAVDDKARDGMDRRAYRDSVTWREVAADDDDFHAFVRRVRSDRALMNLSTDGSVLFLNGLAAVAGTAGEKAALATLSGGLIGAQGSFDKQLFNLETMTALLSRMKAARLAALVPIRTGLSRDITQYPLEQALVDLRAYADAGSLLATVDAISTDAGKIALEATAASNTVTRDVIYRDSRPTVNALQLRLKALSDRQALNMVFAMEAHLQERSNVVQNDMKLTDPNLTRFKSGANAKAFLLQWLQDEGGASSELQQWADALTLAEKG